MAIGPKNDVVKKLLNMRHDQHFKKAVLERIMLHTFMVGLTKSVRI